MDDRQEKWVACYGYPAYEVSNLGKVRRIGRSKGAVVGARLVPRLTPTGYACVGLYLNHKRTNRSVHRLVFQSFQGPIPEGLECDHLNGNRSDNRLCNLRLLTHRANQQYIWERGAVDREKHRALRRRERAGGARIDRETLVRIERDIAAGLSVYAIAKQKNVTPRIVRHIRDRTHWSKTLTLPVGAFV